MSARVTVSEIAEVLFREDPVGINFETNSDEYESEAVDIARRLPEAASVDQFTQIVHEIFVRWFTADVAGPRADYAKIAAEVWKMAARDKSIARDNYEL